MMTLTNDITELTADVSCRCFYFTVRKAGLQENLRKMSSLTAVIPKLYQEYTTKTSKKLKIIDAYLLYIFLTAVIQFVYCCLVGTFPFNSFLSGFISTVSSFVLGGKGRVTPLYIHLNCKTNLMNRLCLPAHCLLV